MTLSGADYKEELRILSPKRTFIVIIVSLNSKITLLMDLILYRSAIHLPALGKEGIEVKSG